MANDDATVELAAEWALWGKQGAETTYRILACSAGDLTAWDFSEAVVRYATGMSDRLPQYTVFWVPGSTGDPEFVGIAIHEHASYSQHDARSHYDTSGREIVYTRLYCVRYADLAEHRVTVTELRDAVGRLPSPDDTAPVTLRVAARPSGWPAAPEPADGAAPELAELVAALLLTTRPVCVVAPDMVPAPERVEFIDEVLSLLPYGLRATLSAATWVSPTAQGLKFRLFFASTRRDDDEQTHHVMWERRTAPQSLEPGSETASQYLDWLRNAGTRAKLILGQETAPLRFTRADVRRLVADLPRDLAVTDTLEDLAASLHEGDAPAATAEVRRLGRRRADRVSHVDREHYRNHILRLGLLGSHEGLAPSVTTAMYRALLRLAFEPPFSYADYCTIEDGIGEPPRGKLRSVLLGLRFTTFVPWLLVAKAEPRCSDGELITALAEQGIPAGIPLSDLLGGLADIRPAHRADVYDFAVLYLRTLAENAKAELTRRGYLADILEVVFPDQPTAQQTRLEDMLRSVHGGQFSRGHIRDLFREPDLRPTAAFEEAVARLASSSKAGRLIAEQANEARARRAANGEDRTENEAKPQERHLSALWPVLRHLAAALDGRRGLR
jgi:hypothetical protein